MNCERILGSHWTRVCGSRYMMRLLLLLVACVAVGLSYDTDLKHYGDTYRIYLPHSAYSLEYSRSSGSEVTVLWKRGVPLAREDNRRKVISYYYVISNVTQEDGGRYTLRGENRLTLSRQRLEVEALTESYLREIGEELRITFNLERHSCNIYFFPNGHSQTVIVHNGWLQLSYTECTGFKILHPCGILNYVQASCRGHFEVRDHNDNKALVVSLDVESDGVETSSYLGIGGGILISALCTCCLRCCCCKKKSSDKEGSEAAADEDNNENEPAVHYHEYDQEPVGQRQNQPHVPSGTQYPAQPSFTPAAPLIHNPPTNIMPPAYSKFAVSSEPADAPTVPLYSDSEPRFEVKGMNFNSEDPLSSDPTHSDVYTSDKLNFL
ncbi:uncharacterized protein LOC110965023 [Acanthochromis polyacanthus]|uniref:uncharacterized protein LOC110965023 n=1 Tax=Acanthochromis polyacanthus TaxID=80966 RepID=UPI0022348A2E|nr:uncharacterized protein LOC110965023 [Acanthochromis polyacanthus]